ncbi:MAG TPA: VOC family protein [Chloroflexota bacterium]|jgi:catechol 2,3-dioxygenase-like lactoylglutathione lyase family enzyme
MAETIDTPATATEQAAGAEPRPAFLSHVSIPVRDRHEAARWFIKVLGAEMHKDNPTFTEVRVAGAVFGLSEQKGGWTAHDAEFPHYAFEVAGKDFPALKARLEANGVKTHPVWSRHGVEALMYFRDPSGNLFELYCTEGFEGADGLPRPPGWGGDFRPPLADLSYDWQG